MSGTIKPNCAKEMEAPPFMRRWDVLVLPVAPMRLTPPHVEAIMAAHNGMLVLQNMGTRKKEKKAILACVECSERNYSTEKSQNQLNERLELKKYCPRCASHTLHRETR